MCLVFIVVNILNWILKNVTFDSKKGNPYIILYKQSLYTRRVNGIYNKEDLVLIYLSACCFVKLFFINISLSQPSK